MGRKVKRQSLERRWINQPSTLQPLHKLHGTDVLLDREDNIIYFLSGPVTNMDITGLPPVTSPGWLGRIKS
jgi:hypothetical protein